VIRYDKRVRLLAALLSALAGYVDAIGFIHLGGFFVSFMSGNSTRLGVGLADNQASVVIAAALVATFVAGVVIGSMVGHFAGTHRRPAVLVLVAALLALAAGLSMVGVFSGAVTAMALAMGAENAVFEQGGEVHIGLTYMTGTLVKLGQRITAALFGGDRLGWAPYLMLWLGLVGGALAGAVAYNWIGLSGLWFAAAAAAIFALASTMLGSGEIGTGKA
jgi:uncharacterized membrane protein YoaK (UPF0700 family)